MEKNYNYNTIVKNFIALKAVKFKSGPLFTYILEEPKPPSPRLSVAPSSLLKGFAPPPPLVNVPYSLKMSENQMKTSEIAGNQV